jgi:hypothetical protein
MRYKFDIEMQPDGAIALCYKAAGVPGVVELTKVHGLPAQTPETMLEDTVLSPTMSCTEGEEREIAAKAAAQGIDRPYPMDTSGGSSLAGVTGSDGEESIA